MKPNQESIRVAIYARVSGDRQAEEGTIASQVEELQERLRREGLTLDPELCFLDDGYCGATFLRPGLERLRDQAAAGAVDRLYVHCPDRLARKYAYQVLLVEELQRAGVEVVFLNRRLGQSPEDDLLLQMQGMIAEYERAKILERSRRGKLHRARTGQVAVLSGAPYGYRYVSKRDGAGQARYEICLEEARVVRQIFAWVGQERCSLAEVCRRLQQQGIASPRGKSCWERTTVWGLLKNPAYQGRAAFCKTQIGERRQRLRPARGHAETSRRGYSVYDTPERSIFIPVPALISEELFAAVAEQLEENRRRSWQRRRGACYLLQGLVVCRHCGYAYYGKPVSQGAAKGKTRRYAYYRCIGTDAYRFGGQRLCRNKQVRTDMLEEAVWKDVCSLLREPERVEQEYQRRLSGESSAKEHKGKEQLEGLLQKVKRGIARLIDAYSEGLLDKSEFEPRVRRAKERLAELEKQAKVQADLEEQQRELRLVIGRLQEFAERVREGLNGADWSTRREIIRTLVKRVEIGDDDVRVIYRVDVSPFVEGPEGGRLPYCWRSHGPRRGFLHITGRPVRRCANHPPKAHHSIRLRRDS